MLKPACVAQHQDRGQLVDPFLGHLWQEKPSVHQIFQGSFQQAEQLPHVLVPLFLEHGGGLVDRGVIKVEPGILDGFQQLSEKHMEAGDILGGGLRKGLDGGIHNSGQQILFVGIMVGEGPQADPRRPRDLPHGDGLIAPLVEQLFSCQAYL